MLGLDGDLRAGALGHFRPIKNGGASCLSCLCGNGTVGAHGIGYEIGQNDLEPINGSGTQDNIALVDDIKERSDYNCDIERATRHAIRNSAMASELPFRGIVHSAASTRTLRVSFTNSCAAVRS